MQHAILTQKDLQNAGRRLRKDGCTRFHQALREDKSAELVEWAQSGIAPLLRRSRDGRYPFCDFLSRLGKHRSEHAKPIEPMPSWWAKYKELGGEQGWIAQQEEKRTKQQQADQLLTKLFLEGIDWTKASDDFKSAIREHLPSNLDLKTGAGDVVDAALKAGLVLSPFEHQGITMTMAMWSLLRPIRDSNVGFWLDREMADPPGNGPGFLSIAVACWKASYRQPIEGERWIQKAQELGADVHRSAIRAKERERFSFDELILEPAEDHEKTILGQAQQTNDPILLRALTGLAKSREELLETYYGMVRGLVEEARNWRGDPARDERINELLLMLIQHVPEGFSDETHPTAGAARKTLLLEAASHLPQSHFPRMGQLLEHTQPLPHDNKISLEQYRIATMRAAEQFSDHDLVAWMEHVERRLTHGHQSSETIGMLFDLLSGFGNCTRVDMWVDKIFHAIDHLHDGQAIGRSKKIDDVVFNKGIRPVMLLEAALVRLDVMGYCPGEGCWEILANRLAPNPDDMGSYVPENRSELEILVRYLRNKGTRPNSEAFKKISKPLAVEGPARNGAYCRQGQWSPEQIWQVRWYAFEAMAANHPDLDSRNGNPGREPMDGVLSSAAQARFEGDASGHQMSMLRRLVDLGASVEMEKTQDIESDHPYWEIAAYHQHKRLEESTAPGMGRTRASRL